MMFFVLVPQTVLIELILEQPRSKKLFIPILVAFKERLDKSERLPGIERDRLSPIKNSFVLRQIDPVKGVILTPVPAVDFRHVISKYQMALLPGVHAQPGPLLPAITTTSPRHQRRKRRGS